MYYGSIYHGDIINAFLRNVPGSYVRDYRDRGGFITVARGYKDIPWNEQMSTTKVYKQVPEVTLVSLPKGMVQSSTIHRGLALERTGWRLQFREAMRHLTHAQMKGITRTLGMGEVFPGIV